MKRSEYEKAAPAFRALLNAEALKPQAEQQWPEMDEWLSVPGEQACTTPGCVAFGRVYQVTLHENADGVFRGQCGPCGQPITPTPVFEEESDG